MDAVTGPLFEQLAAYGPWLLFALAVLETCFLTGLFVPSGVATSVATVLALEGSLELPSVIAAALAGGAVGDSLGYWVGRFTGERFLTGKGRWSRLVRRHDGDLGRFFGRHPAYSVSLARMVSFVRTLMPMTAGMSEIPYPRYLAYELAGLVACVAIYVSIGALAQESWELATQVVGVGGAVAFAVAGAVLWTAFRRRHRQRRAASRQPSP